MGGVRRSPGSSAAPWLCVVRSLPGPPAALPPSTAARIRDPISASTCDQYQNARLRTGGVTPWSSAPATVSTNRSRAASSKTSRTRIPGWPKSSSSARSVWAQRIISPSASQPSGATPSWSGIRPPDRVGRIGRRGTLVVIAHRPVEGVGIDLDDRFVDRQLIVVDAEPGAVGIGIREDSREQHPVGRNDPGDDIGGRERRLVDLGEEVLGFVGRLLTADQGVVAVRPDLVRPKGCSDTSASSGHDLDPGVQLGWSPVLIASKRSRRWEVGASAGDPLGVGTGPALQCPDRCGSEFRQNFSPASLTHMPGVRAAAVHEPPRPRQPVVARWWVTWCAGWDWSVQKSRCMFWSRSPLSGRRFWLRDVRGTSSTAGGRRPACCCRRGPSCSAV